MGNSWIYNDMQQIGTDYHDFENVEIYDRRMSKLRDVKSEVEDIIEALNLTGNQTIIEFGSGTGEVTCPPKTDPNIMLGSESKIFRRRQVNGPKKVHTGTDHPKTQRS
jgi:hypothetical protein